MPTESEVKQSRRQYTEDFKREAVKLVEEQGRGVAEVARSLDVHRSQIERWTPVTEAIIPELGPVEVAGYHALVVDVTEAVLPPGKTKTQFDADVPASANDVLVPKQFLEPARIYELEILTTEAGGNQTITEGGVFCTPPIEEQDCEKP